MYGLHLSLYGDRKSLHFPSPAVSRAIVRYIVLNSLAEQNVAQRLRSKRVEGGGIGGESNTVGSPAW